MKAKCDYCGKEFDVLTGHYNRAMSRGLSVYCSRKHSGLGRRVYRTDREKKELKATYDAIFRLAHEDRIKKKKAEYFKKDYAANPKKYKAQRTRRLESHKEYCRKPEYRAKKKKYDRVYRAIKFYGPMAEPFLAYMDLRKEIDNHIAREQNNTFNKSKKRKKQWQKMQPKSQMASLLRA